jgi:hypothetical protein
MKHFWIVAMMALGSCESDDNKMSTDNGNNPPPPTTIVLKTGTFSGQNGYVTSGMMEILRDTTTDDDYLHTLMNFSVSGGAGTIAIYLSDAAGAANLTGSSDKIFLGNITSGFSGEYTFAIPAGFMSHTHAVTFCVAAQVNFGNAALQDP